MTAVAARWHGDQGESSDLVEVVQRHCTCIRTNYGVLLSRVEDCPAHMLLTDQRAMDGLLTYRHLRGRLVAEEWGVRLSGVPRRRLGFSRLCKWLGIFGGSAGFWAWLVSMDGPNLIAAIVLIVILVAVAVWQAIAADEGQGDKHA